MDEVVVGMAHRGRLNVLANIVGKSFGQIFSEFEGNLDPRTAHGSGDVKYHLGAEGTYTALDGETVKVTLTSNPSHLETVDPVVEGIARAKQDVINRGEGGFTVLPVLIHGDAAFAGQGVVAETLNLSQLRGYRTGGSVHVVINNQVGFTTSPASARSSVYSTDVARMIQAPIFHVNGDDPEAVVRVAELAYEFRQAFKKDVVIDMLCYRRRGHSEVDEPSFTQPVMYDLIDAKRSVRKLYTESLIGRGDITVEEAEAALRDYQGQLERVFSDSRDIDRRRRVEVAGRSCPAETDPDTAITAEVLKTHRRQPGVDCRAGFTVHPRLLPQLEKRAAMVTDGGIDWAMGELLAFGSLLLDGHPVRLAGQDTRRGTFGQRHSVHRRPADRRGVHPARPPVRRPGDRSTSTTRCSRSTPRWASSTATRSPGPTRWWRGRRSSATSPTAPRRSSTSSSRPSEAKWGQRSSLVLLLPHGYEGQGPDHSSARIERYLAMSAEDNWTIAIPSTPANYFHLLRRQTLSGRQQAAGGVHAEVDAAAARARPRCRPTSPAGGWQPVIADPAAPDPAAVTRVILCSGKVYYDLIKRRDARRRSRTPRSCGSSSSTRCRSRRSSPLCRRTRR